MIRTLQCLDYGVSLIAVVQIRLLARNADQLGVELVARFRPGKPLAEIRLDAPIFDRHERLDFALTLDNHAQSH